MVTKVRFRRLNTTTFTFFLNDYNGIIIETHDMLANVSIFYFFLMTSQFMLSNIFVIVSEILTDGHDRRKFITLISYNSYCCV